jgi:uncharacterized protein (TIGR02466 family)
VLHKKLIKILGLPRLLIYLKMIKIELFKSIVGKEKLKQDLFYLTKLSFDIEKTTSKVIKSNFGGFNSGDIDSNLMPQLTKDILHFGNIFFKNFNLNEKLKLGNIWININRHKDSNLQHAHPFSKISGVFYIKAPKNSGNLVFINPHPIENYLRTKNIDNFNHFNSKIWSIPPEENILYLFPSWLEHRVDMNLSKEERISVSFNLI